MHAEILPTGTQGLSGGDHVTYDTFLCVLNAVMVGMAMERERKGESEEMQERLNSDFPGFYPEAFNIAVHAFADPEAGEIARRRLLVHAVTAQKRSFDGLKMEDLFKEHAALRAIALGSIEDTRLWMRSEDVVKTYYTLVRKRVGV